MLQNKKSNPVAMRKFKQVETIFHKENMVRLIIAALVAAVVVTILFMGPSTDTQRRRLPDKNQNPKLSRRKLDNLIQKRRRGKKKPGAKPFGCNKDLSKLKADRDNLIKKLYTGDLKNQGIDRTGFTFEMLVLMIEKLNKQIESPRKENSKTGQHWVYRHSHLKDVYDGAVAMFRKESYYHEKVTKDKAIHDFVQKRVSWSQLIEEDLPISPEEIQNIDNEIKSVLEDAFIDPEIVVYTKKSTPKKNRSKSKKDGRSKNKKTGDIIPAKSFEKETDEKFDDEVSPDKTGSSHGPTLDPSPGQINPSTSDDSSSGINFDEDEKPESFGGPPPLLIKRKRGSRRYESYQPPRMSDLKINEIKINNDA